MPVLIYEHDIARVGLPSLDESCVLIIRGLGAIVRTSRDWTCPPGEAHCPFYDDPFVRPPMTDRLLTQTVEWLASAVIPEVIVKWLSDDFTKYDNHNQHALCA